MEWYYANESDQQVSFQEENFPGLVEIGSIKEGTLVWNETMPDWKPCREVRPNLFEITPANATPAAVSSIVTQPAVTPPGPPPASNQTDGLSIASLVCGIIGFLCYPLGLFLGLAAVICGHISRKRLFEQTGSKEGGGLALAGVILGYIAMTIGLAILAFYLVVMISGVAEGEFSS